MTAALPESTGATGAIPSIPIESLLAQRDAAVRQIETIAAAVAEYGRIGEAIMPERKSGASWSAPYKFREPLSQQSHHGPSIGDNGWLKHAVACIDASLWDLLFDRSGLRTFMDAQARKEWADQIEKNATPPLTAENVAATFRQLHAQRGEFFERGVVTVFRRLSWDYKTNSPRMFGKRIILTHVLSPWGHTNGTAIDGLDDMERAMCVLDGKPEPDHRSSVGGMLRARSYDGTTVGELASPNLKAKTYKNGNAHVTFLRADLVDKLNLIIARHYPGALPPAEDSP